MVRFTEILRQLVPNSTKDRTMVVVQSMAVAGVLYGASHIQPVQPQENSNTFHYEVSNTNKFWGLVGIGAVSLAILAIKGSQRENPSLQAIRRIMDGVNPDGTHLVTFDRYGIDGKVVKARHIRHSTIYNVQADPSLESDKQVFQIPPKI